MTMRFVPLIGLAVALAVFASPARAAEEKSKEPQKVLNVIAVKVKGDLDAYLAKVKKLREAADQSESGGTFRVWRAAVAGQQTGTVYIGIEYPSLEAYAEGTTKQRDSKEWTKLMKDLDASGVREVQSSMLLVEVTP